MPTPSPAIVEESIVQLEALAAVLADEIQQPWTTAVLPLAQRRLRKEALLTISVLLPKLHAVQRARAQPAQYRTSSCPACED
jgi:hypothetical protein